MKTEMLLYNLNGEHKEFSYEIGDEEDKARVLKEAKNEGFYLVDELPGTGDTEVESTPEVESMPEVESTLKQETASTTKKPKTTRKPKQSNGSEPPV